MSPIEMPDFKPDIPPDVQDECTNKREIWIMESVSVLKQQSRWNADTIRLLSNQFELFNQHQTNLRNQYHRLKEKMEEDEKDRLRKQTVGHQIKYWGKVSALIASTTLVIDWVKQHIKL